MKLFRKRPYIPLKPASALDSEQKPVVPEGLWEKCPTCQRTVYSKDLGSAKICPYCQHNFRISAQERLRLIVDADSFEEWDMDLKTENPIDFPGYEQKLESLRERTGLNEAVVTGKGMIEGNPAVICVMDSSFLMGSMGTVVGEKLTRAFEHAASQRLPVIVFTASGGARMQEGILSLMQMAKVSIAVGKHNEAGLLYISVLTDPTTGGVTASFAMQGDVILAEPGATIGFAGKRVIEQTIKATVPEDFQTAEQMLEKGFVDRIVPRPQLREALGYLLGTHRPMEEGVPQ